MKKTQGLGYLLIGLATLTGCQHPPTKSYDSQAIQQKPTAPSEVLRFPVITDKTLVIDARPPFEFALTHINGSINLRWEDFSQPTRPFRGELELDHFGLARRFATYGISPSTPVVVVGRGPLGGGEEGRLAWTLKYLGVQDVRFASVEAFSIPKTLDESPPRKNEPIWKPELDSTLNVDRTIFVQRVMKHSVMQGEPLAVIDVRTEAEYLGKDLHSPYSKSAPDLGAFNIPWTEFFDSKGLAQPKIKRRILEVGIRKDQDIYVIDNWGVRSAAVTLALRELGFSKASNFSGGYMELIESK